MEKYAAVPNIISSKDLDYLSDMFNWNYGAYKCTYNSIENIKDIDVKNMVGRVADLFYSNMSTILSILEGGNNE
ncbi:MAG: hypothetical protein ACI31S_04250 [Bacilli bacterium]